MPQDNYFCLTFIIVPWHFYCVQLKYPLPHCYQSANAIWLCYVVTEDFMHYVLFKGIVSGDCSMTVFFIYLVVFFMSKIESNAYIQMHWDIILQKIFSSRGKEQNLSFHLLAHKWTLIDLSKNMMQWKVLSSKHWVRK